jgi:hypothetical protein
MAEQHCEHFDCACPPFVTDGRVSEAEWDRYVAAMDLTYDQVATAKVVLQMGQDPTPPSAPETLSRVPGMTERPMISLGSLPSRLDNHLNTVNDSAEDRASSWAAAAVPTMRAIAEELYKRYSETRELVGNVDGMLLAAATVSDLADAIVIDYGITECLRADQL